MRRDRRPDGKSIGHGLGTDEHRRMSPETKPPVPVPKDRAEAWLGRWLSGWLLAGASSCLGGGGYPLQLDPDFTVGKHEIYKGKYCWAFLVQTFGFQTPPFLLIHPGRGGGGVASPGPLGYHGLAPPVVVSCCNASLPPPPHV